MCMRVRTRSTQRPESTQISYARNITTALHTDALPTYGAYMLFSKTVCSLATFLIQAAPEQRKKNCRTKDASGDDIPSPVGGYFAQAISFRRNFTRNTKL